MKLKQMFLFYIFCATVGMVCQISIVVVDPRVFRILGSHMWSIL